MRVEGRQYSICSILTTTCLYYAHKHYFRVLSIRHIIWAILLLCSTLRSTAQEYDVFDSYGIDDGLPQSSIWHITQDKNGFMWFSTADGICRFDGYDFTVYRNDPADSNSLLNSTNCHFYIDSEGDLWTISMKGVCLYNYEKDKFNVIYRDDSKHTFYYYSNCFFGEYNGYLWASMPLQGILKIDKKSRKVEFVEHTSAGSHEVIIPKAEQKGMFSTGVINNGKIWLSISPDKCVVYDIDKDKVDKPNLPYIHTLSNFNDSEVVASVPKGLLLINKNTYKFREVSFGMEMSATQIMVVPDSQLIIACVTGLVYVDTRSWKVTRIVKSFAKDKKVTFSNVRCLYTDRSGNLWIGTDGDGIKKLRAPNKKFRFYSSFSVSNLAKAIYATSKRLYVGYFKNDLDIFDRTEGFIENRMMTLDTFNYHNIYAMTSVDSSMLLLRKLDPNIVYSYSLKTGKLTSLFPLLRKILLTDDQPYSEPFFYKKEHIVYTNVGSNVVALDVSSSENIKPSLFYSFRNEIPTNVFIDSKGTYWLGTKNGLYYIENGKAILVTMPEMLHVKTISEDAEGNIWAGSLEGIYIVDTNKKFKLKYNEKNGLSNGFIYGIIRHGDDMWFSHNKGLTVYNTITKKFKHYTKEDGLQSNEFNTGAYFKAADGTLFFGGIYGTNGFRPEEIKDNPNVPRVVITNIKLFDKNLQTDIAYWNLREVRLPYTQNSLTFEFAGLEYTNSEQNQYAYIMEGLDEKWIYSGNTRFARYPALPPGTYYFKVKASNNDGIWQETPTVIKVVIVPPFWQTWWFRTLCGGLLILVIVGIVNWFQKQRP